MNSIQRSYQTVTVTINDLPLNELPLDDQTLERRQVRVTPTKIPSYASACYSTGAYSSACSCVGITATTITTRAPVETVTEYVTVTSPGIVNSFQS